MSFEITQVKDGRLVKIVWTTSLLGGGVHSEGRFHLGCFSYYPTVSVRNVLTDETNPNRFLVCFDWWALTAGACCSHSGTDVYCHSLNRNELPVIWSKLNGGEINFLRYVSTATENVFSWIQSEEVEVEVKDQSSSIFPFTFVCEFWIKLTTLTSSEKNTLKRFSQLFDTQKYCDIEFCFLEKSSQITEKILGAHVNVLSIASPVFAAMFENDMLETKTGQVIIEDICHKTFKKLLQFIYTGRVYKHPTENSAKLLYVAADKYDIEDLKEECVEFLLTCIYKENVISLMVWAHLYNIKQLEEEALTFIVTNGKEICMQLEWEELTNNYPKLCLLATRKIIAGYS